MRALGALIGPEGRLAAGSADVAITGLCSDSRDVRPGDLFAAMPGTQVDGARFVPQAVSAGAVAVLCAEAAELGALPEGVAIVRAADPRLALARMAARFFERQPETVVAVTGTSGKSSVAEFTRQILIACGHRAAAVGTVGIVKPDGQVYGSLTTPDPITFHETLAGLADEGITHLAFEASSHGLDQRRLDGVKIVAAGFTNLGRDHLDYHETMEAYFAAKARLFDELVPGDGVAVCNSDDLYGRQVAERARVRGLRVLTVGSQPHADIAVSARDADGFGQTVVIRFQGVEATHRLRLIGAYQAENAALAAGLAIAVGEDPAMCFRAFETLTGVSGRLEPVGEIRGASVIVDYAHKPDALEAALTALRPFAKGRLICVFGCGGDRDRGKRPLMGEIAGRLSDVVIVTDDNPRSEVPAQIRADILTAVADAREIGDRAEAIAHAAAMAQPGDVVLIAGKGHETGQIVGDTVQPFSDQDVARAAIAHEASRGGAA